MSIKKLFDSTGNSRNYLSQTTVSGSFKRVESSENIKQISTKQNTFVPQVDYSEPSNFAKYGSAYLYYKAAVERIYDYYPYDGSDAEINKFYNELLDIEKYIFNNLYPRTNGHALLCADGWGSLNGSIDGGYGTPSSLEYITFYGGPHTSSYTKLADAFPSDYDSQRHHSNIYDTSIYTTDSLPSDYSDGTRESNLKSNFDTGVTLEFWLKKAGFDNSKTEKEVVFDMWNNATSSVATYGRLRVELTGATSGSPFLITAQSSSSGIYQQSIGQNLTTASLSTFSHYAVTFYNSGSSLVTELYVNGVLNDTNTVGSTLNELNSKNMAARIGALLTSSVDSSVSGPIISGSAGAGKLSGSLDEFRFWKVRRNAEDIGLNWKAQVRGGANTDISNTTLGVYFKFNEGIVGDSTVDNTVLDYSGRLSNGVWTGYDATSRSTASAFVEAGVRGTEYHDPIIYSNHPSVSSLRTDLLEKGRIHDLQNNSSMINMVPSWIVEGADGLTDDVRLLNHVVATYFDKVSLQIQSLSELKTKTYTSASSTPYPFASHYPQSLGLYTPEIFVDSTVIEKFKNRTESTFMESDLNEIKNLIYLNIYNNISGIYKAKGTEKAIKNVFRCFNLDDRLIKLRTYANNEQFTLENNLVSTISRESFVNSNLNSNIGGVVYQAADASNSESLSFISGTYLENREDRYGFTLETSVRFPKYSITDSLVDRDYTTVSLFGLTLANTASSTDLTWASPDPVNFQVFAVRPKQWSRNVYFKLTSSVTPFPLPELTSSLFFDVYDNQHWNFSVRLKPSNYPLSDIVTGSSTFTYDVEFEGVNAVGDTIQNSFLLTGSVSQAVGSELLKSAKRVYVGARRTNITGAVQVSTDVLFGDTKYWLNYLDSYSFKQHLFDLKNAGISGSYEHVSPLDSNIKNTDVKRFNTLALHWTYDNITGSDSAGNFFYVNDMSSGSVEVRNNYGWIGAIAGSQHTGYGYGYAQSSTNVIKKDLVDSLKFVSPEEAISSDLITVVNDNKKLFGLTNDVPVSYYHTIEKSMYNAISEEMLKFFAGAVDFNNVIGEPVHRYRERYKSIEKLREQFFRKVPQVSKVEKFINYYKWLDDSISQVVEQLLPASSNVPDGVYNIVESHVLERNKYKTQFPTIEFKQQDPETSIMGINELDYNWKFGHAPVSDSQSDNTLWWNERADRVDDVPSGVAAVDAQRETLRETIKAVNSSSAPKLSTTAGTTYAGSVDVLRRRSLPYKLETARSKNIKGGVNFESSKNVHLTYNALHPAGPVNVSDGVYVPTNVLFAPTKDLNDIAPTSNDVLDPNKKTKRFFKVQHGRDWNGGTGYTSVKSSFIFPFNVVSSSVSTGHNKLVQDRVSASVEITNVHNDVYGPDMEVPMQGPFTDYAVGGHQSRHVRINQGSDTYLTRPEAWKILLGTCDSYQGTSGAIGMVAPDYPFPEANDPGINPYPMTGAQKAVYYRDHVAKRPVNIRNILLTTGSTILGNYSKNYQLVQTVGGFSNPRAFVDNPPNLPTQITQTPSASQGRSILDIRRSDQSHFEFIPDYDVTYLQSNTNNKSVIRSRFSNPGGIETLGQGYGDIRADELSVYNAVNYRNLTVKRPFQNMSSTSEAVGAGTTGIRVSDQNGNDYGLIKNLSDHCGLYGRENAVTNPGASLIQNACLHKINRNPINRIEQNSAGNFITGTTFDNFYVQHQIPRSDKQYSWITGSVAQAVLDGELRYYGYMPTRGSQEGRYSLNTANGVQYVAWFDFVTKSATSVGALFQPANDLNIYVTDPVNTATDSDGNTFNNLGLPLGVANIGYYNTTLLGSTFASLNGNADYFNLLMTKRRNTFGYRGVPNTSPVQGPVIRAERRNNILTTVASPITSYTLKPFSRRGRPVYLNMDVFEAGTNGLSRYLGSPTLKVSYNNNDIYFSDTTLNDRYIPTSYADTSNTTFENVINVVNSSPSHSLNWVLYCESLFPSALNENTTASANRVGYDNLFWRDDQQSRIDLHADSIDENSYGSLVNQSSWPLDAPLSFLTRGPLDIAFIGSANNNLLANSNSAGELQNEYTHIHRAAAPISDAVQSQNIKIGGLYSRKHLLGGPKSLVSPTGMQIPETGSGYANNPTATDYTASFSNLIKPFAGEAVWEAGSLAGKINKSGSSFVFATQSSEPWYGTYDDFKRDLDLIDKDGVIVPEFRISEHVSDYISKGTTKIDGKYNTFEIVGTSKDSSDDNFYMDFSNSEFMKNFARIEDISNLPVDEIKLVCSASIKFNPYKGFYPAQRTLDLVERFQESYRDSIIGEAGDIDVAAGSKNGVVRPLAQAFFAPGIMYNTIKAGLAVDYPMIANASKFKKTFYATNDPKKDNTAWMITSDSTGSSGQYGAGGLIWDKRVPFEAIIQPEKFVSDFGFVDMEPHPSASLNTTSSLTPINIDELYSKMASNFFGEIPNFFLQDSSYTRLESSIVNNDLTFTANERYGARIKLRRSMTGTRYYDSESGSSGNSSAYGKFGGKYYDISTGGFVDTRQFPLPQDPRMIGKTSLQETFTMYSRPTAYGPPISGRPEGITAVSGGLLATGPIDSVNGHNPAFTPPYYDGEAWLDLIFEPQSSVGSTGVSRQTYDLQRILSETKTVSWRFDPGYSSSAGISGTLTGYAGTQLLPTFSGNVAGVGDLIYDGKNVNVNSMQLTHSINCFGIENVTNSSFDKFGTLSETSDEIIGMKWVIQPKMETPHLNFNNNSVRPITNADGTLSLPSYSSGSVPRGMWHQFGLIEPDPSVGLFLEISEIPTDWLKNHYDVVSNNSIYNNNNASASGSDAWATIKPLTDIVNFNKKSTKLGKIADSRKLKESIVAVPYQLSVSEGASSTEVYDTKTFFKLDREVVNSCLDEAIGTQDGDSLDTAGISIRNLINTMQEYVLPPQFDFLSDENIDPMVMYFFEFEYDLDKDDLSYIWQNLAPRDYKKITQQSVTIAHKLGENELMTRDQFMGENIRWMLFKVKQKGQSTYSEKIVPRLGQSKDEGESTEDQKELDSNYVVQYNWPYDYVSFVEKITFEASALYKQEETNPTTAVVGPTTAGE